MIPHGAPRKSLSDSELDTLEQLLQVPAHSLYDHVLISLTAHSLLVSHLDVIGTLSLNLLSKIDARTIELRAQTRPASGPNNSGQAPSNTQYRPFVPPPVLPKLTRSTTSTLSTPLDEGRVQDLLASPSTLVGKSFFIESANFYYRVAAITLSLADKPTFQLQYEDVSYAVDDVPESEMKSMLINSTMVNWQPL
ncbi:hypothetical protein V8E55_005211 [Tylopilus felleus]